MGSRIHAGHITSIGAIVFVFLFAQASFYFVDKMDKDPLSGVTHISNYSQYSATICINSSDCETDKYAITMDTADAWKEALVQALDSNTYSGKDAGVLLYLAKSDELKYVEKLNKIRRENDLNIRIWYVLGADIPDKLASL